MNRKGRVLVLTGGGPAPGHNAVIYAATKRLLEAGYAVIGCLDGWKGLINQTYQELTFDNVDRIFLRGGTIIGTSRTNLRKMPNQGDITASAARLFKAEKFIAGVFLGGEDTTSVSAALFLKYGIPAICGPKTIDNDLWGTPQCYGFDTAANNLAGMIRGMHDDFAATHYVGVFQGMGRNTGWLTLYGGIAGGAHVILIPEFPQPIDQIVTRVVAAHKRYGYCMVAVAEELRMEELMGHILDSCKRDAFGNIELATRTKGWAQVIAEEIEEKSKLKARPIIPGHLQRGGPPSVADTIMCLRFGHKACELVQAGIFGKLITWGDPPDVIDLAEVVDENGNGKVRCVPLDLYEELTALLPV